MNNKNRLLLSFAATILLLVTAGCWASDDRVDTLEQDIRVMQAQVARQVQQQQSVEADVTQRLSDLDERMRAAALRLTELKMVASELSESDYDIRSRMSEIESRLDERAINRILMMPLPYLVAILILLIGILIGFWGHRWKVQRDLK